jgi:ribonuclease HepT-like protein
LHSFYSGIENCLKRIAIEIDGSVPSGDAWHSQLLKNMASATNLRPQVLSEALFESLREYLAFRHFFRQAYSFHFDWVKMSHLVLKAERTLRLFEVEMDSFLDSI